MAYQVTVFSNRFYVNNESNRLDFNKIDDTILKFNKALYFSYNLNFLRALNKEKYNKLYGDKSTHMVIKEKYGLDDYYTNSINQLAKGKVDSQVTLNKDYKNKKEEQIDAINKKIENTKKLIDKYIKLLENLHIYQKSIKENPNSKIKFKNEGLNHISIKNKGLDKYIIETKYIKNHKIIRTEYGLYEFEYKYLYKKIKYLKNIISKLIYRLNNTKTRLKNLDKIKHIQFKKERKYNNFEISGRSDAKYGNFIFKFKFKYKEHKENKENKKNNESNNIFDAEIRLIDDSYIYINNIIFPYQGELISKALTRKMPLCFGIIKKRDGENRLYYQFKCSFDIEKVIDVNTDKSTGVFGMDFNYGHLDISEIDNKGNLIDFKTIPYKIDGTSKENELSLQSALKQIGELVSSKNKVLVIEKINTKNSKVKSTYKSKVLNRIFHTLPYDKYLHITHYLGLKYGFDVIEINPALTSVIGKYKYAYKKKLNTHISASFVIARRGMKFNEFILKEYKPLIPKDKKNKHHLTQWIALNIIFKKENKKLQQEIIEKYKNKKLKKSI